ncbi:hypothetical protein NKJ13_07985 [Mesorhizobium sp. M0174]|uniref:hypothetical protein n=1 Tax=Mesorhizobium sp. M0174 TaxID=2956904 RepID=UPI00333B1233
MMTGAERANHMPQAPLVAAIRATELALSIASRWITIHRDNRASSREARCRSWCEGLTSEHAELVSGYERRFGDIPRLSDGLASMRADDHG